MKDWLEDYLKLFFQDRKRSYELKLQNTPKKLYKYQPVGTGKIRESRINTLKNNEIWFTKAPALNDPFDCQATYYQESELIAFLKESQIAENKSPELLLKELNNVNEMFRSNIHVACFSEQFSNMPLWGNYADNHKGICLEYDFTGLEPQHTFSQLLFPVMYQEVRHDVTDTLKKIIMSQDNLDITFYRIFFSLMLKHKSWEYEREWRILHVDIHNVTPIGIALESPIKPTAVYFGLNCPEEDIQEITAALDDDVKKVRMTLNNHEFFHLDVIE